MVLTRQVHIVTVVFPKFQKKQLFSKEKGPVDRKMREASKASLAVQSQGPTVWLALQLQRHI